MSDLKIKGYVIAQVPNLPLTIALLAIVAGWILNEGSTAFSLARAVFFTGFTIWAYLELAEGVNGFRRLLGLAGIAYVVVALTGNYPV